MHLLQKHRSHPVGFPLTLHARRRLDGRGIRKEPVLAALKYGRVVHVRGAAIHVLARREIQRYARLAVRLAAYEGVQVICDPQSGAVLTVYRNRDFRSLRPRGRKGSFRCQGWRGRSWRKEGRGFLPM